MKLWPSTAASWSERPVGRVEAVEAGRDERLERLRDGQLAELADRLVAAVVLGSRRPSATSIRTVSTAYSGMPSARATIERTAALPAGRARGRPAARASRPRSAAPGRGPGSCAGRRPSRAAARAAPGGPGSRSRIGTPRLHSSRWSMKSSRPASAQWRSSNRRVTTVPVAAIRSKNVRHARNSSSRPPAGRVADARAAPAARGSIQRRSSASGTCVGDHLGDLRPGSSPGRRSRAGRPGRGPSRRAPRT